MKTGFWPKIPDPETGQNLPGKFFSMKVAKFNTEFDDPLMFSIFWAYTKIWNNLLIRITTTIPHFRSHKNKFARLKKNKIMLTLRTAPLRNDNSSSAVALKSCLATASIIQPNLWYLFSVKSIHLMYNNTYILSVG